MRQRRDVDRRCHAAFHDAEGFRRCRAVHPQQTAGLITMLGKLTLAAIPLDQPIIMGAVGFMVIGAIALLAAITYFRLWGPLWSKWLTSIDHKNIGIMYILL